MNQNPEKMKPTVLIAEDDPDDRLLLEEIFSGFADLIHFQFVDDGEELMEILRRDPAEAGVPLPRPSLILMDLNMPRKDGRQALFEIKGDESLKGIPVVVLTTSALDEDKILCSSAGADGYVTKPGAFTELDQTIRQILADLTGHGVPGAE